MRSLLPALGLVAVLGAGTGVVLEGSPALTASGPVTVSGTEATGVFTIAGRTVRQVRYADQGTLRYSFTLTNDGGLPLTVTGLADAQQDPRLFDLVDISGGELSPGDGRELTLSLHMNGCESLSSRSGSFVSEISLRVERVGVLDDVVTVPLPEEIHTGSPREAYCPRSTTDSRPQG